MFYLEREKLLFLSTTKHNIHFFHSSGFILSPLYIVLTYLLSSSYKSISSFPIYGIENAQKEINKINKLRANHYKHYTDREWSNNENYDISVFNKTFLKIFIHSSIFLHFFYCHN